MKSAVAKKSAVTKQSKAIKVTKAAKKSIKTIKRTKTTKARATTVTSSATTTTTSLTGSNDAPQHNTAMSFSTSTNEYISSVFQQQSQSHQSSSTTTSQQSQSTRSISTSHSHKATFTPRKLTSPYFSSNDIDTIVDAVAAVNDTAGFAPTTKRTITTKTTRSKTSKTRSSPFDTATVATTAPVDQQVAYINTISTDDVQQQEHVNTFLKKNTGTKKMWTNQKRQFRATRPVREEKRDYYEVLGISRNADEAEIKKAYFALAKKYHPDMSKEPDAQKKFAEVSVAYECLSNADKRKQYDQFGHDAEQFEQAGYGPGPGFNPEDILREMFFGGGMGGMGGGFGGFEFDLGGGHAQQQRPRKGTDVQVEAKISFMEAVNGVEKQISVKSLQPCDTCKGKGDKPGAKVETCRKCNGSGVQRLMKGMFQIESICQPCGGKGQMTPTCNTCNGETLVEKTERVTVRIPPGVDASTNLRLANQGDAGYKNGPRGHLWVKLNITPDARFRREGSDVHVTVPLPLTVAVLGGVVDVPTLNGDVRLKIPPGSQQKDTQIMRNSGIKVVNRDQRGHQYVHFEITVPKNISPRVRELMEEVDLILFPNPASNVGANNSQRGAGRSAPKSDQSGFGFFGKK